ATGDSRSWHTGESEGGADPTLAARDEFWWTRGHLASGGASDLWDRDQSDELSGVSDALQSRGKTLSGTGSNTEW
ncbi:hypothetical protein Pmar_PMAR007508, partial [Perkinsus marinus ATCC 50983]